MTTDHVSSALCFIYYVHAMYVRAHILISRPPSLPEPVYFMSDALSASIWGKVFVPFLALIKQKYSLRRKSGGCRIFFFHFVLIVFTKRFEDFSRTVYVCMYICIMYKNRILTSYLSYVPICPLCLLANANNAFNCKATAMRPLTLSWPRKKAPSADIFPAARDSSVSSEQRMLTSGLAAPVSDEDDEGDGWASRVRLGGQCDRKSSSHLREG
jgi:hypothetical protein